MRVITLTLSGSCKPDDMVVFYYEAMRGGRTETAHLVRPGQSLADVAIGLAAGINTHFVQPLFNAKSYGAIVTVYCLPEDVAFGWYCEHLIDGDYLKRAPGGGIKMVIAGDGIPPL